MGRFRCALLTAAVAGLVSGCAHQGVVDDATSVSWGPSNRGRILAPAELPREGEGYVRYPRWHNRGLAFGTDELVELIVHTGRRLSLPAGGSPAPVAVPLGVGDLSLERGGPSAWHRSHQTGRDVDLVFFMADPSGALVPSDQMIRVGEDGVALQGVGTAAERRFDVAANWRLVRALLESPVARVQFIFIYDPLKQMLLDYAIANGEPLGIVALASFVLHQPGDSLPHDDHMHVRVFCSDQDAALGCVDRGDWSWRKKAGPLPLPLAMLIARAYAGQAGFAPLPAMFVLGVLPFSA